MLLFFFCNYICLINIDVHLILTCGGQVTRVKLHNEEFHNVYSSVNIVKELNREG